MKNLKEKNKSIIEKKEDIMNYDVVKNGETKEEVKEWKDWHRQELVEYLNEKWRYANSKAYNERFRDYKLVEMISEITDYLYVEDGGHNVISHDEQFLLLTLIRALAHMTDERTPDLKKRINKYIKELETQG